MDKQETQRVLARIVEAEAWRDGRYGPLWEDCFRRYRSQPAGAREGSNLFVPHTFMQTEVIKARLEESLFSSRPYISALPREGTDAQRAAKMQLLLDWQLNERMDLPRLLGEQIAGGMMIYGTGVAYTGWQLRTRRVTHAQLGPGGLDSDGDSGGLGGGDNVNLSNGDGGLDGSGRRIVTEEVALYDDPIVANIPLTSFFVDPTAHDIETARFCGHSEYVTRAMLEEWQEQGKYSIDWQKLPALEEKREGDDFEAGEAKQYYLLHHYWEDERHLVLLNRAQLICEQENPFWHGMKPYDKCCYATVPGEFYGMGVPELLAGLQDELNTARNQRIDYNSLALRRMWKLRKGCGLTARDLLWRQNGVLQVENMDDVQEINIQSLPPDAFANESSIKQDMQDVTGCHDIIMGLSYINETATTTLTRDNNASLRFKSVTRALIQDLLLPIARKCVVMDQQFLDRARAVRLLGAGAEQLFSVTPQDLLGEFDVVYCGTAIESMANKELNKEKVLQAYSLALADPAYQNDDLARMKLFRKVLNAMEMPEADELLPRVRV